MKTQCTLAGAAVVVLAAVVPATSSATVPPVDAVGEPAVVLCRAGPGGQPVHAVHTDKIIFKRVGMLVAVLAQDQAARNAVPANTALDIKVIDDPKTIADLKGKVLTFMGAQDTPANRGAIQIIDVEYAMVCPSVFND